jgi:hypothetical protein
MMYTLSTQQGKPMRRRSKNYNKQSVLFHKMNINGRYMSAIK